VSATATAATEAAPAVGAIAPPGRRRTVSPITRRIFAVNVLALLTLVAGLLYVADYRRGLIAADLAAIRTQAELFAVALGEGATGAEPAESAVLIPQATQQMVRRLVEASGSRARLFGIDGVLLADSRRLLGPSGPMEVTDLPPPAAAETWWEAFFATFDRVIGRVLDDAALEIYTEKDPQTAADYGEVMSALQGEVAEAARMLPDGGLILSVAAPVRRYQQILGALTLTRDARAIDAAVLEVRLNILKAFAVTLVVTVLLSVYLSGTIARPLLRLAAAAERVRHDPSLQHTIPDYADRGDEIGELAAALRDMTNALRLRMDAIEQFAADVAHEIKNPLTSLRSAVETATRLHDPDQTLKMLAIIESDVHRLDRLISDISDASRLDAELSRAVAEAVDVGAMLEALRAVTVTGSGGRDIHIVLDIDEGEGLVVSGLEGRLVQVFRNLIANAVSFSPSNGRIALKVRRDGPHVVAEVCDEGPGVPENKKETIFERFYSERPEGETFGLHSGLGLSISKQIVDAHRGTIHAENIRDADGVVRGARFVVRLPAA
jgi:two-component system sensor histidine kinase ChvG